MQTRYSPGNSKINLINRLVCGAALLVLLFSMPQWLQAQGTAQVIFTGVPPTLGTPSVAGQIQSYDQGNYAMQFMFTSPSATAYDFRFNFRLELDGDLILDIDSEPVSIRPGVYRYQNLQDPPPILFSRTLTDVIDELNAELEAETDQTGFLPEGTYTLIVEAVPDDPSLFISSIPGMATFEVIYPEPPFLLSPVEEELVSPQFPVFSWTPVIGTPPGTIIEYELLIVEVLDGQAVNDAILANRPRVQTVLTNQTSFTYGPEQLPLEPGKLYAWQVTTSDMMDQIPFQNEGRTEIYTFRATSPGGGMPEFFAWQYPLASPFVNYEVPDALVSTQNVQINGRYQGQLGGITTGATFDELLINDLSGVVEGGRVIFDRSPVFRAQVSSDGSSIQTAGILDPGSSLDVQSGFAFEPGITELGAGGFRFTGRGTGSIYMDGMNLPGVDVSFSPNLRITADPVQITQGRLSFLAGGAEIAYADPSGFYLQSITEESLMALLPERLPLPSEEIAYLKLHEGDISYVSVSLTDEGLLAVSSSSGQPASVILASIQGQPEIPVSLEDVLVDPASGAMVAGRVSMENPDGATQDLLLSAGIPMRFDGMEYTAEQGLLFSGALSVFDQVFDDTAPLQLQVNEAGRLQGLVEVSGSSTYISLVEGSDKAVLNLQTVDGFLDISLSGGSLPYYDLTFNGNFEILEGDQPAASAGVEFKYNSSDQFTLLAIGSQMADGSTPLQLDGVELLIEDFTSLDLNYVSGAGFDFSANLDLALLVRPGTTELSLPIGQAELRNDGFFIPQQNYHEGLPGFTVLEMDLPPARLQLLAFRLPATTFDWFSWSTGTPSGLHPQFDFEVSFPGFEGRSGAIAGASATLQNAELDEGFLSGDILPYTFQGEGAFVPFGGTSGFSVHQISGSFSRDGEEQDVVIEMTGRPAAPDFLVSGDENCRLPVLAVEVNEQSGFVGQADDLEICSTLSYQWFDADFTTASFIFGFESQQQMTIAGIASASANNDFISNSSGEGTLAFELVSGTIVDSDLTFENAAWSYPAGDPFFTFSVPEIEFSAHQVLLDGTGALEEGNASRSALFENLTLNIHDGSINEGHVEFPDGMGLELGISPQRWVAVAKASLDDEDENRVLLLLPDDTRLDRNGILINETGTAYVQALGVEASGITADFENFRFGTGPSGVRSGRVSLSAGQEEIGYIDAQGLHLENPPESLPVPDILPLPDQEIAYLRLRDGDGNRVVELEESGDESGGSILKTIDGQTAQLVLASLGEPGNQPEVDISFQLNINPVTYQIIGGNIELDVSDTPIDLAGSGYPMNITGVEFSDNGQGYQLLAHAQLILPDGIPGLSFDLSSPIVLDATGFKSGTLEEGTYSLTRPSQADQATPLTSVSAPDSMLAMNVQGLKLQSGTNPEVKISGDISSMLIKDMNGNIKPLHYAGFYNRDNRTWEMNLDFSHLSEEKIPLDHAFLKQDPDKEPSFLLMDDVASLEFSGVLSVPEMGGGFGVTAQSLYIGTDRVEVEEPVSIDQKFSMFSDFLLLRVLDIDMEYDSDAKAILLEMDGTMNTKITRQAMQQDTTLQDVNALYYSGLKVGTDGSFAMDKNQGNLLASNKLQVLNDVFWFNELKIEEKDNDLVLSLGGYVDLPVPGRTGSGGNTGQGTQGNQNNQTGNQNNVNTASSDSVTADTTFRSAVRVAINSQGELVDPLTLALTFDKNPVPMLGNNPGTEFKMGEVATFEFTGAALDFDVMNPVNTTLYATAALHIHSGSSPGSGTSGSSSTNSNTPNTNTTGPNKDKNGKNRVIALGNANNIRNRPGVKFSFSEGLQFILDVNASEENPLFSFKAGMFSLGITSVYMPDISNFEVKIGGVARLELDGISGSLGYKDFTFNSGGVTDWGRPSGSFSLEVMDVVAIELGQFEYKRMTSGGDPLQLSMIKTVALNDGTQADSAYTIEVRQYLRFGGASISMGADGAFGGGVDNVLYYQGVDGSDYLSIENANFSMSDQASLSANLEFMTDDTGFMLRVSGVGKVSNIGMAAVGKISTINNQLSFGIFLAATGAQIDMFPIVPNTIILTGAGGGFFYRPDQKDLQIVVDRLGEMTDGNFKANNPRGYPKSDDMLFAVMLYAEVGLVGTSAGGFAVQGNTLITITDQFGNIDINGILIRQNGDPQNGALGTLRAGMYLTAKWPTPQDTGFLIQGGVSVNVEYPVVEGEVRVDMFLAKLEGEPLLWGLSGSAKIEVMSFITLNGKLLIGPDGMLVELGSHAQFDIAIISVSTHVNLAFWYYEPTSSLGVYTQFGAKAEVLGGVATLAATMKGALLVDESGYLVYVQGSGYVKVLFVFEGNITVWASIRNDDVDAGIGKNDQYETMIADSRSQVTNLQKSARELRNSIDAATKAAYDISQQAIEQAGLTLRSASPGQRQMYADLAVDIERSHRMPGKPLPPAYQAVANDIIAAPDQPVDEAGEEAYQAMVDAFQSLNEQAEEAARRVQEIELEYAQLQEELATEIAEIRSPLTVGDNYRFTIDQELEQQQTQVLSQTSADMEELLTRYRQSIITGGNNIHSLTLLIDSQEGIAPFFPAFSNAYEVFSEYYARQISFHLSSLNWANQALDRNRDNFGIIYDDIESAVEDINSPGGAGAYSASEMETFKELAGHRYSLILQLAADDDSLRTQADLLNRTYEEYRSYLDGETPYAVRFETYYKGINFWSDVIWASLNSAYLQWHREQWNSLPKEHRDILYSTFLGEYRQATGDLGQLYLIKTQMIETQVAMIDEFLDWSGHLLASSEIEELKQERREWALMLEPPRITSLAVTPERTDYYNRAHIEWEAYHPQGEIAESLIRINRTAFFTMGKKTSLNHYAFKGLPGKNTENMEVELAVRGPGGTLFLIQSDNIQLSVAPEGDRSEYVVTAPNTSFLSTEALEPPSAPEILMPLGEGPQGYWVSDPGEIHFIVQSYDPAGGQLLFEAALGSGEETENIREWQVLPQGVRPDEIVDEAARTIWQEATGYQLERYSGENDQAITFEGLNLQPGTPYNLSIRAVNGYDKTSPVTTLAFRYDNSAPVFMGGTGTIVAPPPAALPPPVSMRGGTGAAPARPEVIQPFEELEWIYANNRKPAATQVMASWPQADDPQSGIYRYQYLLSYEQNAEIAFQSTPHAGETAGLSAEVEATTYKQPYYLHVRAINYGGGVGYFTEGPFELLADPTRPLMPQTRIGTHNGDLVLWITSYGHDTETDLAGYQYAAGSLPNGWDSGPDGVTNLRPWPASENEVQLPAGEYDIPLEGNLAPGYIINPEGIEAANPIYVYTRSVNTQGRVSNAFGSGGSTFRPADLTPPQTGEIFMEYQPALYGPYPRAEALTVFLQDVVDPGSGLSTTEMSITDQQTGEILHDQSWESDNLELYRYNEISVGKSTIRLDGRRWLGRELGINFYIENGAGLSKDTSAVLDLTVPPPESRLRVRVMTLRREYPMIHMRMTGLDGYLAGITRIEYRVEDAETGEEIYPWTDTGLAGESEPMLDGPYNFDWYEGDETLENYSSLQVSLRVTNGLGAQTVVTDMADY